MKYSKLVEIYNRLVDEGKKLAKKTGKKIKEHVNKKFGKK